MPSMPDKADPLHGEVTIGMPSEPRLMPIVRAAVHEMTVLLGFSSGDCHKVVLAVDEAITNVIKHAYGRAAGKPIAVSVVALSDEKGRTGIRVAIRDQGKQVDPSQIKGRDLNVLEPGGLGVHIMRSVMDRVEYVCLAEGGTELVMEKFPTKQQNHPAPGPQADGR